MKDWLEGKDTDISAVTRAPLGVTSTAGLLGPPVLPVRIRNNGRGSNFMRVPTRSKQLQVDSDLTRRWGGTG